jgi:hypothetical protein
MLMTTPQVVSVDTVVNHRTYEGLKMDGGLVYLRTTTLDWPDIVCAVAVFQPDCFKKRQNQLLRPATYVEHQLGRPHLCCPLHFQSATKLCISKVGPSLPCKAHISSTHYIHAHTTYLSFRATSIRRNFASASNHILPYEKSRMQRNPLPDCHYPFKEDTKAIITPYQIHNFRTSFQIDFSTPPTVDEIKISGCARFPINSHTML